MVLRIEDIIGFLEKIKYVFKCSSILVTFYDV